MNEKVYFLVDQHRVEIVPTRRKGSIALKVAPDRISLLVPSSMAAETLQEMIVQQQEWFRSQINQRASVFEKQSAFDYGCEVLFWGEAFRSEFSIANVIDQHSVKLCESENTLSIYLKPSKSVQDSPRLYAKRTLEKWFIEQFSVYVLAQLPTLANQIGVDYTDIKIRSYKARWGSCYPDGRMQFNWRLVMAPKWVVNYVLVHELCHLVHANHSKAFWALVEQHDQNVKAAKKWLKQHGNALIHF